MRPTRSRATSTRSMPVSPSVRQASASTTGRRRRSAAAGPTVTPRKDFKPSPRSADIPRLCWSFAESARSYGCRGLARRDRLRASHPTSLRPRWTGSQVSVHSDCQPGLTTAPLSHVLFVHTFPVRPVLKSVIGPVGAALAVRAALEHVVREHLMLVAFVGSPQYGLPPCRRRRRRTPLPDCSRRTGSGRPCCS